MAATAPQFEGWKRVRARPQSRCFVCGQDNPVGLRMEFERELGGAMRSSWSPRAEYEGFRGIVHGGVVSTVLDEAMSKAVAAAGIEALTAELKVRLRRPVHPERSYVVRGWVVSLGKRLIATEASITSADGEETAHAWASFLTVAQLAGAGGRRG
ncbi:MAG: PaaI family thioesterase [Bryobacteraceae bacterium]|nr:PaaI family thioesterase [Bryobacteraceae bacterium]